jgi:hypothetical protein
MKLALIPPISLLGATLQTDYQLMLPQLTTSPEYSTMYDNHCKNPRQFVILDNGEAEGYSSTPIELMQIANSYKVDEIVLPDVIGNMDETLERSRAFLDFAGTVTTIKRFQYMFVCQGQDEFEFIESADIAARWPEVTTIGIPRHALVTCDSFDARKSIANILQASDRFDKRIHFLGANPISPREARFLADPDHTTQRCVRGMDTSMPFNYALAKAKMDDGVNVGRAQDYFNLPASKFDGDLMQKHLDTYKYWARYRSAYVGTAKG